MNFGLGPIGMLLLCLAIGTFCGAVTGMLYYLLKIPTLIVSLGMVFLLESLSAIIFNGAGVLVTGEYVVFSDFIPMMVFGMIVFLVAIFLYFGRPFGYHVRV